MTTQPIRTGAQHPVRKPLRFLAAVLTSAVALVAFTASCGDGGGGASGLKPGKLAADTPPVTFTQPTAQPMSSTVLGQSVFVFKVDNTSHCDLSLVKFGAVLFDAEGTRIDGAPTEVGLTPDVGPIHPGESYEGKFTTGNDKAVRAVVVLKEVIYLFVPEGESNRMFSVPMKWVNAGYDAQVSSAAPK